MPLTYDSLKKIAMAAAPRIRSRRKSGTKPATANKISGVQVNKPRFVENQTFSISGRVGEKKFEPCGAVRGEPYRICHASICGEKASARPSENTTPFATTT